MRGHTDNPQGSGGCGLFFGGENALSDALLMSGFRNFHIVFQNLKTALRAVPLISELILGQIFSDGVCFTGYRDIPERTKEARHCGVFVRSIQYNYSTCNIDVVKLFILT